MHITDWIIETGMLGATLLAVGPWMFKVHAKLAVIAAKLADVADQLKLSAESHHELWNISARHEARLERHEAQIAHLEERLDD